MNVEGSNPFARSIFSANNLQNGASQLLQKVTTRLPVFRVVFSWTYPDTDTLKVRSGRQVLVFNIRRNDYRLIVAAHFNRQIVYTLRFMTHAEYSKDRWKDTL